MGFGSYHNSGRWTPEMFDTGIDKVAASLANIPRQIFEGLKYKREDELKERAMANDEERTKLAQQKEIADQKAQEKAFGLQESRLEEDKNNRIAQSIKDDKWLQFQKEKEATDRRVSEMQIKQMQFMIDQAKGKNSMDALKYQTQEKLRNATDRLHTFIQVNGPFKDKNLNSKLIDMMRLGSSFESAFEAVRMQAKDQLPLDTASMSKISEFLREKNLANNAMKQVNLGITDSALGEDYSVLTKKQQEYEKSIGDLDESNRAFRKLMELFSGKDDDEKLKVKAAISDIMHKRPPNELTYGKAFYQKMNNLIGQFMKGEEKREKDDLDREHYGFQRSISSR